MVKYHVLNGQLAYGQNVLDRVTVVYRPELLHVTIVMLVNACRMINQIVPICVVNYHALSGQLLSGHHALNLVMVVFRHELSHASIVMLVIVF